MSILPKKLSAKIPVIMVLAVTVLVAMLVGVSSWMGGQTSIKLTETALLNAAQGRTNTVTLFMQQIQSRMKTMASHTNVADAATELFGGWRVLKADAPTKLQQLYVTENTYSKDERYKLYTAEAKGIYYDTAHKKHQPRMEKLLEGGIFEDIKFFDEDGNNYYSYRKGAGFAQNISEPNAAHPELIEQIEPILALAKEDPDTQYGKTGFTGFIEDEGKITAYMVGPIQKWGRTLGAVAFKVNTTKLARIIEDRSGLGKTGHIDLVSADMEAISFANNSVSELPSTEMDVSLAALNGEVARDDVVIAGHEYRAIAVPMKVLNTNWAVVARKDYTELLAPANELRNSMLAIGFGMLIVIGAGATWFVRRSLAPLQELNEGVRRIAKDDLNVQLKHVDAKDEVGELSRSVEVLRNNAIDRRRLEDQAHQEQAERAQRQRAIETMIDGFRSSSSDLLNHVSSNMDNMQSTARILSEMAEETANQASSSASASEVASSNVQTVASAAEELAASIEEIKRQVDDTAHVVNQATEATRHTNEKVSSLSQSAQKIGAVVSLIQDIAEQTNLLALNATIEAARAGEHGKGFAVVASEVKELANQTSKATEEISTQIQEIQGATDQAVSAIAGIATTMEQVNDYTNNISVAVDQQGAATVEISQNVAQAANGTEEVAGNMSGLSASVAETTQSVEQVEQNSQEVADQTTKLRQEVDQFLKGVAAA